MRQGRGKHERVLESIFCFSCVVKGWGGVRGRRNEVGWTAAQRGEERFLRNAWPATCTTVLEGSRGGSGVETARGQSQRGIFVIGSSGPSEQDRTPYSTVLTAHSTPVLTALIVGGRTGIEMWSSRRAGRRLGVLRGQLAAYSPVQSSPVQSSPVQRRTHRTASGRPDSPGSAYCPHRGSWQFRAENRTPCGRHRAKKGAAASAGKQRRGPRRRRWGRCSDRINTGRWCRSMTRCKTSHQTRPRPRLRPPTTAGMALGPRRARHAGA